MKRALSPVRIVRLTGLVNGALKPLQIREHHLPQTSGL